MRIGGNTSVTIQQKASASTMNAIGERVTGWIDIAVICGWLDMTSGDSKYTYSAKLEESTHVFVCDYIPLDKNAENKRLVHSGDKYDVLMIDDPMELHQQLEIFLKKVI